jgi:predicted Rossmann fold flavoprotein
MGKTKPLRQTLIVIGGGAAGFFCAVNAAKTGILEVILLEKSGKLLSKVRISGGGRCNLTHACFSISEMAAKYPRGRQFVKKTFHRFFTKDTIEWFESRGVPLKTEPDGRIFPVSDSSQSITDCLLQEAVRNKVDIRTHAGVENIRKVNEKFEVQLDGGRTLTADFITVACGGFPKAGMFGWLQALGHSIEAPAPSLFTFNFPRHPITQLMGISLADVLVKVPGTKLLERGPVLITHWGLSGPAVLRLSAWGARELQEKNWHFPVQVNWLPEYNEENLKEKWQNLRKLHAAAKIINRDPFNLPARLWAFLLEQSGIPEATLWAELPAKGQNKLIKNICSFSLEAKGKTTFKEEFVTAGGILLSEINAQTMESRIIKNLYFAGEVLNVDGITGGFNFQNAWTTGFIAAENIMETAIAALKLTNQ